MLGLALLSAFSCTKISYSSHFDQLPKEKSVQFRPVIQKLLAKGADTVFVYDILSLENTKFNEKYVKINVTGYLKSADYSHFSSEESVASTKEFMAKYAVELNSASQKYGVFKEDIAAILWIETRWGGYLGSNHIPSVYLSTALASEDCYIEKNIAEMDVDFSGSSSERKKLIEKIKSRAKKKSEWAIGEILALEKIRHRLPTGLDSLFGSWAGAFGISQFLPSSYSNWSADGNGDGVIDLFNHADAIHSVANYLKTNGWDSTEQSRTKSFFHYNNSRAYTETVLKLSNLVRN